MVPSGLTCWTIDFPFVWFRKMLLAVDSPPGRLVLIRVLAAFALFPRRPDPLVT